jgi:hypothetical protein
LRARLPERPDPCSRHYLAAALGTLTVTFAAEISAAAADPMALP